MAGELVPVVMLPRYTVFAGKYSSADGGYSTIAMDVTEYQNLILNVWRNKVSPVGGSPTPVFGLYFEESTDQVGWTACSVTASTGSGPAWDPGDRTEIQYTAALTRRWFRIRVVLTLQDDAMVTCWAVGFLEQRLR